MNKQDSKANKFFKFESWLTTEWQYILLLNIQYSSPCRVPSASPFSVSFATQITAIGRTCFRTNFWQSSPVWRNTHRSENHVLHRLK